MENEEEEERKREGAKKKRGRKKEEVSAELAEMEGGNEGEVDEKSVGREGKERNEGGK